VDVVSPGSPADRAGLAAGDTVISVNGAMLRDVIDWQWFSDADEVAVRVRSQDGTTREQRIERRPGESWGISFVEAVFDGVKTCRNRCAFCFMSQLPPGLRRSLYVRDDDYRLSFLQGNFVTLTNLRDVDVRRIAQQHLSPLYVSLHAVDPEVRRDLVCARNDRALERFDELLTAGTDLHVQIVLVPGVNDGDALERTLTWLAEREGVLSVGIVPLGYTSYQSAFDGSYEDSGKATAVIGQIQPWQLAFRERDGVTWVYLADEFYLNAGAALPIADHYDRYPQYENGVGLARAFTDEFLELSAEFVEAVARLDPSERVTLVTGSLFAPLLESLLSQVGVMPPLRVAAVDNGFFGGNISVAGLLTAADLVEAFRADGEDGVYLLPAVIANADGLLLDDVPASELGIRSGRDVRLISCDARGLLDGLRAVVADPLNS
jgi:putative radical SAM enzyme (TIGR03279 family)